MTRAYRCRKPARKKGTPFRPLALASHPTFSARVRTRRASRRATFSSRVCPSLAGTPHSITLYPSSTCRASVSSGSTVRIWSTS